MSHVSIVYCKPCGYEKRATDTAAALRARLKLDVNLIPGKGGIFEVRGGDQVVAKRAQKHFPDNEEIVAAVSSALRAWLPGCDQEAISTFMAGCRARARLAREPVPAAGTFSI
jgi:selenoprotein W-related protein